MSKSLEEPIGNGKQLCWKHGCLGTCMFFTTWNRRDTLQSIFFIWFCRMLSHCLVSTSDSVRRVWGATGRILIDPVNVCCCYIIKWKCISVHGRQLCHLNSIFLGKVCCSNAYILGFRRWGRRNITVFIYITEVYYLPIWFLFLCHLKPS